MLQCHVPEGGQIPKSYYQSEEDLDNPDHIRLWADTIYQSAQVFKGAPHEVIIPNHQWQSFLLIWKWNQFTLHWLSMVPCTNDIIAREAYLFHISRRVLIGWYTLQRNWRRVSKTCFLRTCILEMSMACLSILYIYPVMCVDNPLNVPTMFILL